MMYIYTMIKLSRELTQSEKEISLTDTSGRNGERSAIPEPAVMKLLSYIFH